MKEVAVTWKRALKIWSSFIWRWLLLGIAAIFLVAVMIPLLEHFGIRGQETLGQIALVLWIMASFLVLKYVVENVKFSDFRIALIELEKSET